MKKFCLVFFTCSLMLLLSSGILWATPIKSYTSVLNTGPLIDFEGYTEGTLFGTQFSGVTFGEASSSGLPKIDSYNTSSWQYGYGSSSGNNVLTAINGLSVFGITATFSTPQFWVQAFLSDTSPHGNYTVQIFGSGNVLLESLTVSSSEILPPGYSGGYKPVPGTTPLPGIYVGFIRPTADIVSVQFGPSSIAYGNAFAIDDLRLDPPAVPEPGTLLLLGSGIIGLWGLRKKFKK